MDYKKSVTGRICLVYFAVFVFAFSPFFAKKANAQWVVFDPSNFANTLTTVAKDYGLDAVAWQIANMAIKRMAASTVSWINSGFEGSPAYVTNPQAYFTDLADKSAGQFIYSNKNLNFLCGNMSAKVKIALANNYTQKNVIWKCSVTGIVDNLEDFQNDFTKGGWPAWLEMTQNDQNNYIGAYFQAENAMNEQIKKDTEAKKTETNQNNGFLSYKKCKSGSTKICMKINSDGSCAKQDCAESDKETLTPGSVIQTQLNNVVSSGQKRLEVADEINEIVSALLNQLLNQVVGGVGSLFGSSQSSSDSSNSTSLVEQLSSSNTDTDQFGNSQDTSVADSATSNATSITSAANEDTSTTTCKEISTTGTSTSVICTTSNTSN